MVYGSTRRQQARKTLTRKPQAVSPLARSTFAPISFRPIFPLAPLFLFFFQRRLPPFYQASYRAGVETITIVKVSRSNALAPHCLHGRASKLCFGLDFSWPTCSWPGNHPRLRVLRLSPPRHAIVFRRLAPFHPSFSTQFLIVPLNDFGKEKDPP